MVICLVKIIEKLSQKIKHRGFLKDEVGRFAIVTSNCIIVGRSYIFDTQSRRIVSCHKRAVFAAANRDKFLIMYIDKTGDFWRFDPKDIIENHWENERNKAKMLNFDIKFGEKMDWRLP